jgi:hypothetical protein
MHPEDLARRCAEVIEQGLTYVCLTVAGQVPRRGRLVRLDRSSRRKCPMGEIANWQDNPPRVVAYFDAIEVLAWLAANGLVKVEAKIQGGDDA